jgi:hypothetical protein
MPKNDTIAKHHAGAESHVQRLRKLAEARQRVLAMPAGKAMSAILDHPQPAALVHAFPEADLALLIHEIGPDEALPILALASNRQWEYLLDTEGWNRDQVDHPMTTAWLTLLLKADPDRLVRWCFAENLDFIELYLFRNIEVRIRESDLSPSDLGDGFFSDDDTFYVRFVDYPVSTPAEEAQKSARNAMLADLLRRLSIYDHVRYQGLLMEAAGLIPAETEEELFRLRNIRLAEKGLVPFHDAVGVYQPLAAGELARRSKKVISRPAADDGQLPVPGLAAAFLEEDNLFVRGLKQITDSVVLSQLQGELASLCNQVITADRITVREREQLARVVARVSGYLAIGLEQETADGTGRREALAAGLLQRHLLADIFRSGIAGAMELHWQAVRWRKRSWWQGRNLPLNFWDEAWMGLLGGLLIDRPKYYDPTQIGSNYRDFKTIDEIQDTGRRLGRIIDLDGVLERMQIPLPAQSGAPRLTYKNLLLTRWARSWLELPTPAAGEPTMAIPLGPFRNFYRWLWTADTDGRRIDDGRKAEFLDWLAAASDTGPIDLRETLGAVLEALFDELHNELAPVSAGNLDPRYIQLFLLTP